VDRELVGSAEAIEKELGKRPFAIAYPYGDMGNEKNSGQQTRAAGYRLGFTVRPGLVRPGCPRHAVPRYMVDNFSGRDAFTTHVLFLTCLYGTFQWYERLAQWPRQGRKLRSSRTRDKAGL
jgi:peptidoglycan/xylan/chitin deacetylase (PgdA/CDA1 family)